MFINQRLFVCFPLINFINFISIFIEIYEEFTSSLLLLLLKEVGSAKLRESDIHPLSPKTPARQYQLIDRTKRKGKILEDYI